MLQHRGIGNNANSKMSANSIFDLASDALQVYSGLASEAAFIGKESPGPQAYNQHGSAMGRQVSPLAVCLRSMPSALYAIDADQRQDSSKTLEP